MFMCVYRMNHLRNNATYIFDFIYDRRIDLVDQATATQVQEALAPGGLEPATPSAAPTPVAVTPSPTEPATPSAAPSRVEVTPSPAEATPKSTLGEQPKSTDGDQKASEGESHKDHMFLHSTIYIYIT